MIAVEYHADLKEVQSDARLMALLGENCASAPFDRLAWWQGLAEHCEAVPLLAAAHNGTGSAVLPLRRTGGGLEALGNWYSFRVKPVITPQANAAGLLTALALDLASSEARISLSGIPAEEHCAEELAAAFRAAGWLVFTAPCDINHVLPVAGRDYAQFLSGRPGKLRTTLKRKTSRVETEVLTRFDPEVWADYEEIYRQSWKSDEGSPAFLRAFAEAEGAAGRLRLGIARVDGHSVAAQMWTVEGNTAYIHKLAHLDDAREHSPGTVLSAALFKHVIDLDKVGLVDFGTGDDPYKRDWMEEVRLRYRLDMFRPAQPRNWLRIARILLSRLARRGKHG